jgi:hypothetical protein
MAAANVVVPRHHKPEQNAEADDVEHDNEAGHCNQRLPIASVQAAAKSPDRRVSTVTSGLTDPDGSSRGNRHALIQSLFATLSQTGEG